ncbi:uncharacterized protein LOC122802004 [Protopterus annectens]|uniref:uncharacterized protein LOC122802004 n=1 Tax=Protopterus annectens TaxID=7888 RepID=UPI001CFB817A|nr:uncharacterized protein LOC122802004 [Protopterus annectens]
MVKHFQNVLKKGNLGEEITNGMKKGDRKCMQFVTAVIGEKVVLNCTNHTLEVIIAVFWKFDNKEGSNCSFAWRAEGNMSSSKCELTGITLFRKDLHIFPAELSHTGNYTCRYDYNRGHECVEYNLTVTDNASKGWVFLAVIISAAVGGLLLLLLIGYGIRVKFKQRRKPQSENQAWAMQSLQPAAPASNTVLPDDDERVQIPPDSYFIVNSWYGYLR